MTLFDAVGGMIVVALVMGGASGYFAYHWGRRDGVRIGVTGGYYASERNVTITPAIERLIATRSRECERRTIAYMEAGVEHAQAYERVKSEMQKESETAFKQATAE